MRNHRTIKWTLALGVAAAVGLALARTPGERNQAAPSAKTRPKPELRPAPLDGEEWPPQQRHVEVVVRVYDTADLLDALQGHRYELAVRPPGWAKEQPEYRSGGGGGFFDEDGGRGAAHAEDKGPPKTRDELVCNAMKLIREAVDPTSWRAAGGEVGSIREFNERLVITQTPANHAKIEALFAQVARRGEQAPMVTVRARWILLAEGELAKVLAARGDKAPIPAEVDLAALKAARVETPYRGQATGFDRQTVYIASGTAQNLVTSLEPIVAQAAAAYRPVVERILWGAVLEVRPMLAADGASVVLQIRSVVSRLEEMRTKPLSKLSVVGPTTRRVKALGRRAAGVNLPSVQELDCPDFTLHALRTSIRVPLDKPVLVGGMTVAGPGGKPPKDKALYLIVSVSASKPPKPPARR